MNGLDAQKKILIGMHSFTNVELTVPITETLLELMFDDSRLCMHG